LLIALFRERPPLELAGVLGMGARVGGPSGVAETFLQHGRLLVQLHRGQMRGQLPLLDLEKAIRRPSRGPMGQLRRIGNFLDLPVGVLNPTMGLLDAGADPFHRLVRLADQQLGRRDVISNPLGERPARASDRPLTVASMRHSTSCRRPPPGAPPAWPPLLLPTSAERRWARALRPGMAKQHPGRR